MAEFLSAQMIALYGMKQLAERYLQEMYSGLLKFRKKSLRMMLFSAELALFNDNALELPVQTLALSCLKNILALMERERTITRLHKGVFFQRYTEINELFVPCEYLYRGAELALASHGDKLRDSMVEWTKGELRKIVLPTEEACFAKAKANELSRKCTVIGGMVDGGFGSLDQFLLDWAKHHRQVHADEQARFLGLFKKYDADLDGNLSIGEFGSLLDDICPALTTLQIENMFSSLMAIGEGKIQAEHLSSMVTQMDHRRQAERMGGPTEGLEEGGVSEAEMMRMTRAWDAVRVAADSMDPARLLHFEQAGPIIVKVQAHWRAQLTRARIEIARKHASRASKVVSIGGALGM